MISPAAIQSVRGEIGVLPITPRIPPMRKWVGMPMGMPRQARYGSERDEAATGKKHERKITSARRSSKKTGEVTASSKAVRPATAGSEARVAPVYHRSSGISSAV